jgi:trk system potassium uptake protein TrkH
VNKLTPKISETAQLIWGLYVGITALAVVVYYGLGLSGLAPNMDLYNAIAHAFTSVATAGFSPEPMSTGAFAPIAQWAIVPFMIVGSTNFILIYLFIYGEPLRLLKNEEFHFYLGTIAFFSTVVAAALAIDPTIGFTNEATIRHAIFNATSIITTTGYASADFTAWSAAGQHMLFFGMFLGGMAGSTTCSIKSIRWLVAVKSLRRSLFTNIHPDAVRPVRVSGVPVEEETIQDIYAYVLLSIIIFFLLTVFVVIDAARFQTVEVSEFDALGAAASTFLNIGPAFGDAGPFGTYDIFPTSTKVIFIVLMWIGRIEIIPVLVLFTKAFWTS